MQSSFVNSQFDGASFAQSSLLNITTNATSIWENNKLNSTVQAHINIDTSPLILNSGYVSASVIDIFTNEDVRLERGANLKGIRRIEGKAFVASNVTLTLTETTPFIVNMLLTSGLNLTNVLFYGTHPGNDFLIINNNGNLQLKNTTINMTAVQMNTNASNIVLESSRFNTNDIQLKWNSSTNISLINSSVRNENSVQKSHWQANNSITVQNSNITGQFFSAGTGTYTINENFTATATVIQIITSTIRMNTTIASCCGDRRPYSTIHLTASNISINNSDLLAYTYSGGDTYNKPRLVIDVSNELVLFSATLSSRREGYNDVGNLTLTSPLIDLRASRINATDGNSLKYNGLLGIDSMISPDFTAKQNEIANLTNVTIPSITSSSTGKSSPLNLI